MRTRTKAGVYIPASLLREAENLMKILNIKSKSKLIQEALKLFISENKWRLKGRAVGIIGVVYRHHVKDIDHEITEIQHRHLDIVASTLHVHLDKERCMLAIAVRGEAEKITELIGELHNLKGIEVVRPILLSTEKEGK